MSLIQGNTGEWEVVIGLEVHGQIKSKAKLFSGASTSFGSEPNSQVSFIDAAMPGMLPVLNYECVRQAVKSGLAINGDIKRCSSFDRKNYFYADLPQGYQISQFYEPIVENGELYIKDENDQHVRVGIERIHMEQDAGKSLHDQSPEYSLIDLNRCGVGLMEIVSKPDLRSSYQAGEYVKKLRSILRYVGSCDGDMEKGSFRCDANVSVRRPGEELGTRCEIKNLNSVRNIIKALDYEIMRQIEVLESGGKLVQETRLFDLDSGKTKTMRSKEDAEDYRYFPDPDLLPINLSEEMISEINDNMPELPDAKKNRYIQEFGLSEYDSEVLTADKEVAEYFEKVASKTEPKTAANWITSELFGSLNKSSQTLEECNVSAEMLIELISLMEDGTISGKIAKTVFEEMFDSGEEPKTIIDKQGLVQISSEEELKPIIDEVLEKNADKLEQYRAGKDKLFGFFVGQVMKQTGGKANPQKVNDLLKQKL